MLSNGVAHYIRTYEELIKLYKVMTKRYFTVIAPRAVFLTTEQLEALEENPPLGGLERFSRIIECPVTIEKIINAYQIADDEFEMGFKNPARDIPIIYETLQESIRLWVDIKLNSYNYQTASIDELYAMEKVAKSLFGAYRYYYRAKNREERKGKKYATDSDLANLYIGMLMHGSEKQEDISFVSYIDQYYDKFRPREEINGIHIDKGQYTPVPNTAIPRTTEIDKLQGVPGMWNYD